MYVCACPKLKKKINKKNKTFCTIHRLENNSVLYTYYVLREKICICSL